MSGKKTYFSIVIPRKKPLNELWLLACPFLPLRLHAYKKNLIK
jgi:hypothetical protein